MPVYAIVPPPKKKKPFRRPSSIPDGVTVKEFIGIQRRYHHFVADLTLAERRAFANILVQHTSSNDGLLPSNVWTRRSYRDLSRTEYLSLLEEIIYPIKWAYGDSSRRAMALLDAVCACADFDVLAAYF